MNIIKSDHRNIFSEPRGVKRVDDMIVKQWLDELRTGIFRLLYVEYTF